MKKIPTIFDRDWIGDKTVVDKYVQPFNFSSATATEKLDGMNIRCTIRNGIVVRVEKRRNPTKLQKAQGITEPWYVDASEYESEDKWIYDAVKNTLTSDLPDGEWSGEALGPNIQGNPLNLASNRVMFFSLGQAPIFENVPTTYAELKEWLPNQKSKYGSNCSIEGIVWHWSDGSMAKIKVKDFVKDNR